MKYYECIAAFSVWLCLNNRSSSQRESLPSCRPLKVVLAAAVIRGGRWCFAEQLHRNAVQAAQRNVFVSVRTGFGHRYWEWRSTGRQHIHTNAIAYGQWAIDMSTRISFERVHEIAVGVVVFGRQAIYRVRMLDGCIVDGGGCCYRCTAWLTSQTTGRCLAAIIVRLL